MAATDPMDLASAVRAACIQAALDGYERAQIAGLCQQGAWECAVDAMRMLDIATLVAPTAQPEASQQQDRDPAAASALLRQDGSNCP